ncbi:isochorismatase family protein [Bacillus massiliglaciei]|uniref:isochorismatase family protein n=1 Tax=Bacillus massiliglaciei TaxID=1816693 RepID=UPI000A828E55|nr:isochorismatase family protein [Bacillus massiliglaciei]
MSIPSIPTYSMPQELPQNKVSWKPDPKRSVLLIHDMQEYFLKVFNRETSPAADLISNIQKIKEECEKKGIPVIYTAQPGSQKQEDRALLTDFWGPGLADDEALTKIVDELSPKRADTVLTKWRYSAFKKSNLLDIMQQQGRDQLIICGVYAHIGCLVTACEAFMYDIQPFIVGDAVADFSYEHHVKALEYAAERCASAISAEGLIYAIQGESSTQTFRKQVAELLEINPEEFSDDENLVDRGMDSIRLMTLAEEWRSIGKNVTFMKLAEEPTWNSWRELLEEQSEEVYSG